MTGRDTDRVFTLELAGSGVVVRITYHERDLDIVESWLDRLERHRMARLRTVDTSGSRNHRT